MRYINFLSSCPEFVCLISFLFLFYIFSIIWPLFPKLPNSSEKNIILNKDVDKIEGVQKHIFMK